MTYLRKNEAPIFCFLYQLMVGLGSIECSFTLCEYFASSLDYKIPGLKGESTQFNFYFIQILIGGDCC